MELDLWNEDFLLSQEWALDTPEVKISGHLGDQESSNCLQGDGANDFQFEDASNFEAFNKDDALGLDWMESTDIGALLATLGEGQDDLKIDSSVIDFSNSADFLQPVNSIESPTNELSDALQPNFGIDSFLSPPDSPDRLVTVSSVVSDSIPNVKVESGDIVLNDEFITLAGISIYTNDLAPACNISEDSSVIEDTITFSVPLSPDSGSQSSIIESSPELYKVICTESPTQRFTPYSTSSPSKRQKSKPRKRQPAQPVPEHVIMEQLDKKDRKKLQNKNAALRYRMKKKGEAVDIVQEEKDLEDVNNRLKTKVEDLQREIKYMKTLMEDVCKAKGIAM